MNASAPADTEGFAAVDGAELFYRVIGEGLPLVVVHGGPDFDHRYLLPDLDRLADGYRLIYYDQRGRGRSRGAVDLERLDIDRYVRDLDALRAHLGLASVALLGHSWGGHLAMHYALQHADRVSHLVLLNTAPASNEDWVRTGDERLARMAPHERALRALAARTEYRDGDPQAVAGYYRKVFESAFTRPGMSDRLHLTFPSKEDVLQGRAIEDRLMQGLFWSPGFTILPALARLHVRTLVVHGADDFVPVDCARRIATAIPGARLEVIERCGHFAYIEAPDEVRRALDAFLRAA